MRKTKIVATIGPASESEEMLTKLINEGMDVARLNFSHGTHEEHLKKINLIKKINKEQNKGVAILLDTKGPEIRLGDFNNGEAYLEEGKSIILTTEKCNGDCGKVYVTYKNIINDVNVGSQISLNDGMIELLVEEIRENEIECRILNSDTIKSKRGVNLPGIRLSLPALTDQDKADIKFGLENDIDYIAASFIRKASDVIEIKEYLKSIGGERIRIISKIENQEGIDNFEEILEHSDGIMVARGDMGVEMPLELIPINQKNMIKKAYKSGKLVITATQMLESMIHSPRPTRAEVSDVANAIYDSSSAIMLSGETALGDYPVECIKMMNGISETIENTIK
ncbi:MAG: pyruvate kinase [Clostridia bacterium]|nr:pyruvate kinase [Clostridia bacterium]